MEKYRMQKEGDLYRIIALCDFSDVKRGDEGGLIESENNLSQKGFAWVYGNAQVDGDAKISECHHVINVSSLKFNITVTRQNIVIGCLCFTPQQWKKNYKKLAREHSVSAKEIKYIKLICETGLKVVNNYA